MTKEEKHKIIKEALTDGKFPIAYDRFTKAYEDAYFVAQNKSISDPSIDPVHIAKQAAYDAYDIAYNNAEEAERVLRILRSQPLE